MLKLVVVLILVGVMGSLFSALFFLLRDRGASRRTVKALTFRVGLSMVLFALLMLAFRAGWIPGHGQ
ncbi:twin transmembrane helix small protein [Propionivibrio sp.]|jgi:hypothetical protein|uniref:twin transmembrane helix small protein n=1 Tax=Propionivibrio sp. TaxID=2212460 RepID=UPI00272E760D|nr:twin transmembrane helix small protein [Propionivibrio sp.]